MNEWDVSAKLSLEDRMFKWNTCNKKDRSTYLVLQSYLKRFQTKGFILNIKNKKPDQVSLDWSLIAY